MVGPCDYSIPEWPYAWGGPVGCGDIKTVPDDFVVEERLPFIAEGEGEHVFLQIEKSGENTEFVARLLARFAGVRQRDVGYAGLKDRHARTTQWFSVWLPGREDPDWSSLAAGSIKILKVVRHARKLKRGVIAANHFQIRLRNWQGELSATIQRLQTISTQGFPNYFGEQRFGRNGENVCRAVELARGKVKRDRQGIYLSAIRAFLFNQALAERVRQQIWNKVVEGDICQLDRSNSIFKADLSDQSLLERSEAGEVHATGVLWGQGDMNFDSRAGKIDHQVVGLYPELTAILTKFALKRDWRPLRIRPAGLKWLFFNDNQELLLEFDLPAGSYATALIRELALFRSNVNWK